MHFIHLSDFLPIACLPACVDAEFHHATLGGLWRMWSLSGADFSSQRGCSSQERGWILTATSDVTMPSPDFSSLLWPPRSSGGSPGTGGKLPLHTNYLNARHLTYISPWWVTIANWRERESSWINLGSEAMAHYCPSLCMWSTACSVGNQALPFYLLKAMGKVLSLQTAHFPFTLR